MMTLFFYESISMMENLDDQIINYGENKGKTFGEVKKEYLEKCYETDKYAMPEYQWNDHILRYISTL